MRIFWYSLYARYPELVRKKIPTHELVLKTSSGTMIFGATAFLWAAGLRDGGLRKSEDIRKKGPFPPFFQVLSGASAKGGKGRKRAKKADFGRFPGNAARHPLSPHLLHPHLRHSNKLFIL